MGFGLTNKDVAGSAGRRLSRLSANEIPSGGVRRLDSGGASSVAAIPTIATSLYQEHVVVGEGAELRHPQPRQRQQQHTTPKMLRNEAGEQFDLGPGERPRILPLRHRKRHSERRP